MLYIRDQMRFYWDTAVNIPFVHAFQSYQDQIQLHRVVCEATYYEVTYYEVSYEVLYYDVPCVVFSVPFYHRR